MFKSGIGTPYWFEWEIGILECLKMLKDTSIESVVLQSENFQTLDDVVVNYIDKSILSIQIKHTDVDDNFTYSFLASGERPLLCELALEWKNNKNNYNFKGIQLVTNKKWGTRISEGKCSMDSFVSRVYPNLKMDFSYQPEDEQEQKAVEWYKETLNRCLNQKEMEQFTKLFSFSKESSYDDVDEKIRIHIKEILDTDNNDEVDCCMNNLLSKLRIWATSMRKKQEISREDVYAALCYSDPDIPSYEIFPEKPILPSRQRFAEEFIEIIKQSNNIIFLEGMPGTGKTNFVSYLSQMNNSIVDFRFYTYLPVNKVNGSYSDDEGFYLGGILWRSILVQLKKKFEDKNLLSVVKFPLIYKYMSVSKMKETVMRFLPEYAKCIGKPCYFFIDGLDHAARSKDARLSFLDQLPRPEEVGGNVFFVLVGQPVNDLYPSWMKDNKSIKYIQMPPLENDDVIVLLRESGIAKRNIDLENLAKEIISIIGNNVLNIMFAILELKKFSSPLSFEDIESELAKRCLNKQIDKYYKWIIGSLDKNLLLYKIESIIAFASKSVSVHEIALMCNTEDAEVGYVLNRMYPIVICEKDNYYAFHNDVRLFLQYEILHNSNLTGIANAIIERIQAEKTLWKYKYDIAYNLMMSFQSVEKIFDFINVEYVMDSVLYGISFDVILQQFVRVLQLSKDNFIKVCIQSSAISLCLSQYANCIRYYEKESDYFERKSNNIKTLSEKYCLSVDDNLKQITNDIYCVIKADYNRGQKLFNEYLDGYDIEAAFKTALDPELLAELGYIYRCYYPSLIEKNIDFYKGYIHFVDGWLEASAMFTSEEGIHDTFKFKKYHVKSLLLYIGHIIESGMLTENSCIALLDLLLKAKASLELIIDLCAYGIIKSYKIEKGIIYLSQNLKLIMNEEFEYETDRMISVIKAAFCLYGHIEESVVDSCYSDALKMAHIYESSRGYKPAIEQYRIAKCVFKQYYSLEERNCITKNDILTIVYFLNIHGAGPCLDCNAHKVMSFLKKVITKHAENNQKSNMAVIICDVIVQCLEWDEPIFVDDFNILFCVTNAYTDFIKVAEYWCGENGIAWKSEYDEMESYCKSIIKTLEFFKEHKFIDKIREKQKCKMFGYVGRKDYSIYGLLDCYKLLPMSERRLCDYGMRLFSVSNMANSIGDNRSSNDVDNTLFDDAVKLGYKYLNAFFELGNVPQNLVYWRMNAIDSLYNNIDLITDDSELLALYNLTNAWINPRIEQDKPYNRMDTLKEYNYIVVSRISDPEIKDNLISKGLYGAKDCIQDIDQNINDDQSEILGLICEVGYIDRIEKMIMMKIENNDLGLHGLIKQAGKIIPDDSLSRYVNKCVVFYILSISKYGYVYTSVSDILEQYYLYLSDDSWNKLFKDIVDRFAESDYEKITSLWGDFTIFSMYYLYKNDRGKIETLFDRLCSVHEKISSANSRAFMKKEVLVCNDRIESLCDFVTFQQIV